MSNQPRMSNQIQQPPQYYDPNTYYYMQQYYQPQITTQGKNPPPPPPLESNNNKKRNHSTQINGKKSKKNVPPPPQNPQTYYHPNTDSINQPMQYQYVSSYQMYNPNNYQLTPEQQQYYQHYLLQQQRLYEQQQEYYRQHQLYVNQQHPQHTQHTQHPQHTNTLQHYGEQKTNNNNNVSNNITNNHISHNNKSHNSKNHKSSNHKNNSTKYKQSSRHNREKKYRDKQSSHQKRDKDKSHSSKRNHSRNKNYGNNRNDDDDERQPDVVSDVVSKPSSRFDSRSNMLKRRPVSGVPIALQKKMESGNENISSHLQLITAKETAKSKLSAKFLKKALKKEVLFDGLGDEMINDIVKVMYKVECEKDDVIIKQGEYGDAYFVVESGKFHVLHKELGGLPDKIVGECTAGDAFGEGSLLYSIPRAATLKAVDHSVVWALDATKFIEIRQKISKDKNEKSVKLMKFLKKISLFTRYSSHDLLQLAQAVTARTYKVGEEMVTQGDEAKEFFIIRRGQAEVEITDTNTKEKKIVKELKDGEFFGERGIFLSTRRAATVRAKTPCKCYVILAQDFRNLLDSSDDNGVLETVVGEYDRINFEKGIKTKFVNQLKTKLNEFKNIGILGVGSFGRVSLVEDPKTGKTYSLKKVRKNKVIETGQEEHVRNERAVLGTLNSDFCCKMYATYQDKLNIYFLMEAVLGGELFTVLRWNKRFSEKTARFYAACVVLAFEHLHSKSIIYRDLKPENLLIASNGYCKLVDFGFAKRRNNSCTLCGTPEYLAPEVIQNYPQGFGVDWWELGIFIYEMVVGHAPFQDDPHMKMYEKILTCDPEFPRNQKFTERVVDITNKLLQRDVYKRLGAGVNGSQKVKHHDWFKGLDWDLMLKQKIKPPYVPKIEDETDVSNFETYPEENIDETLLDDPKGDVYRWCQDF